MKYLLVLVMACLMCGCQYVGFRQTDWKLNVLGCDFEAHTRADGSYLGTSCPECPHCIAKAVEDAAKKTETKK